jgi:hypothetical protein
MLKKILTFPSVSSFFGGVTKFEALQYQFVTKLNPPKPSPHIRKKNNMHRDPHTNACILAC